jgi:hypothetical protein
LFYPSPIRKHQRQDKMSSKTITLEKRKSVYAEGRQAFDEHKQRGYNPYAANNLQLAVSWWHGWDTGAGEFNGQTAPGHHPDLIVE